MRSLASAILFWLLFVMATASHATDLQKIKIEQLEELLQNYIEENKALKDENQGLKAQLDVIKDPLNDQVTNTELSCDADPKVCNDKNLCEKATYEILGTRNWKLGSYVIFVNEAKTRDLSCGVAVTEVVMQSDDKITTEIKSTTVETTAKQRCEADIVGCSDVDLCETATFGLLDNKRWKVENYTNFIEEAVRRNVDCGVSKSANEVLNEAKAETKVAEKVTKPVAEIIRPNAREICDVSFEDCRTAELCQIATYNQAGAIRWKIGSYQKYVDELSRRSETCGVLDEEKILSYKSDEELCSHATHESSKGIRWNVGSREIFVEQVKRSVTTENVLVEDQRRGLSCNVQNEDLVDLAVAQIQTRLHHFGYEPGLVDGAWGGKTEAAFEQFLNDNYQTDLSPNSLSAETFLYDLYEEKFEQPVTSSVPCKTITNDYERTNRGECVVIAHFDETSSNLVYPDKGDETTAIWDKQGIYPHLRERAGRGLEIVLWAPDMSGKAQTVHDLPGLAHMANYHVNFEAIFKNKKRLTLVNQSRKMPLSVRRYELSDLNNDGIKELFLLGSREDGRKGGNFRKVDKMPANMIDYNFIYDFEKDFIKTFGEATFSHDYGLHDFNDDGFKDVLDLTLSEHRGLRSYLYCDGKTLNCLWKSTDQFINGQAFLSHDQIEEKVFMNARCGKRHVNDGYYGKLTLCWFEVEKFGSSVKFYLIDKFELQPKFDAKIRFEGFSGDITQKVPLAWKVDGYSIEDRVIRSAGGTATVFEDMDNDGDLDMITYRKDSYCTKKDKSRRYYTYADCDQSFHYDYIFLKKEGKFELSQVIEGGFRGETTNYDFEDLNKDGYLDIIPRGVYVGKCVDTYENVLINNGDGTFNRTNEKFSGRYGCELASNFFEHDGQRYRAFTFKPEVKEHTYFDYDVYLAIEKLN